MSARVAFVLIVVLVAGCSSAGASAAPPVASSVASLPAAPSASPAAASVVCDFFGVAHDKLLAAATAAVAGDNEALPLRDGINAIREIASRAKDPTELRDLTSLADALDAAAMSGGSFSDWDPAFEAFYVKYAPGCGAPIAS